MNFEDTNILEDEMIREIISDDDIAGIDAENTPSVAALREMATKARTQRILRARLYLCQRIEQEARLGNFYMRLEKSADQTEAAKTLRTKGFKVAINDGYAHRISW
jgi:hypothetical protein